MQRCVFRLLSLYLRAFLVVGLVPSLGASSALAGHARQAARSESESTVDPTWWRGAARELEQAEYRLTWQEAWQAPNRAQGFRTTFLERGIRVSPRDGATAWHLDLSLVAYHAEGQSSPVEAAAMYTETQAVRYERGVISEWYANGPDGLRQGFTLAAPPLGAGASSELRLDLALDTSLLSQLTPDGQAADFATSEGQRVVRFAQPTARDGAGRLLPTRIEAASGQGFPALELVVEPGEGAQFPVTLSLLVSASGWIVEGNQGASGFGASVSPAGDVNGDGYGDLIVGAPLYDNGQVDVGRVFVFYGSASGPSSTPAWQAESGQAGSFFGHVVAAAGDVNGDGYADIVIGAPLYDNGQTDEGRVFAYYGSAGGLPVNPSWTAEGNQLGARFGFAVGSAGNVNGDAYADLIVGAPFYDNGQRDEGRVFVYKGSAGGLGTIAAWTAESNQVAARYGNAVGTAGDVNADGFADVIVGAYFYDNGQKDEGRAFVYRGAAVGPLVPGWTAEGNQNHARFGVAVATAGDVDGDGYADVAVGANLYDNDLADEGRVFVFKGSASGLSSTPAWTAEGNQTAAGFGGALAPAGDVNGDGYGDLLIGAQDYELGQIDEGRAFLYQGSATGLAVSPAWTAEGNQVSGHFGVSVAAAGDVNGDGYSDLLAGSDGYDNDLVDEGRASLFYGSPAGLTTVPKWSFEGDQFDAQLGWSVDGAGDVNGDGYDDVMAAAFAWDSNAPCGGSGQPVCDTAGKVWLFYGGPGGPDTIPDWSAEGAHTIPGHTNTADSLGFGVARAGDVNGDGYDDVLLGCSQCEDIPTLFGQVNEGYALLYYGSATGLPSTPDWFGASNQGFSGYGREVASIGDVNGDGYGDIAVGASLWDSTVPDPPAPCPCPPGGFPNPIHTLADGKVFVYYGSPTGPSATPDWTVIGDASDALFGKEIGSAGDVNGDGYDDLMFSATDYSVVYPPNGTTTGKGRVFLYYGSAGGLGTTPDWTAEATPNDTGNAQLDSHFGYGCRGAGDVNGDGYSDVVIGAPDYDNPDPIEGRVYVYYGSATGLASTPAWTRESNQSGAYFGIDVQGVGDVNGDGYADVIIGSDGYGNAPPLGTDPLDNVGRVWIFPGSPTGLSQQPAAFFESGQAYAQAGVNVAAAGDVNGDGFADIVFGARRWDDAGDPIACNSPNLPPGVSCPFKDEGKAWILMGNNGAGLPFLPEQRRVDDTGQIGQGQLSDDSTSFRISLLARAPFGRGRVKLEWEVKPFGTPFDGTATQLGTLWTDTGPAGAPITLSQQITGLQPDTVYHWRVRLRYDPATTAFQHAGRWIAPPRNGAAEADLRTAP
jgi:hypothetical protein